MGNKKDRSRGSAHWWFGPNSMFGQAIDQTRWGTKGGADPQDTREGLFDMIENLFKPTGVDVNIKTVTDEEKLNEFLKKNGPFLVGGYLIWQFFA